MWWFVIVRRFISRDTWTSIISHFLFRCFFFLFFLSSNSRNKLPAQQQTIACNLQWYYYFFFSVTYNSISFLYNLLRESWWLSGLKFRFLFLFFILRKKNINMYTSGNRSNDFLTNKQIKQIINGSLLYYMYRQKFKFPNILINAHLSLILLILFL